MLDAQYQEFLFFEIRRTVVDIKEALKCNVLPSHLSALLRIHTENLEAYLPETLTEEQKVLGF